VPAFLAAGAAAVAVSGLSAGGAGASASRAEPAAGQSAAVSGAQLWVRHYNGPGRDYGAGNDDGASSVAVSPAGDKVFVTGHSAGKTSDQYATVAYNAATGAQLWIKRYGRAGSAVSLAVSPSGRTVFVTGSVVVPQNRLVYATVAYNAATGAQRWARHYYGRSGDGGDAASVAVSPTGDRVFVTGTSGSQQYATVAYNAATGAKVWAKHYHDPAKGDGYATSLAVSRGTVFVTGRADGYVTVAYNAATGAQRWAARYNGPGNGGAARSVAVSPTGNRVFVTGTSLGRAGTYQYATVAYNAATGARLWVKRYHHGPLDLQGAGSVAVSPTGNKVYVTGNCQADGLPGYADYATVAYNAATGAQLWATRYNGPGDDRAAAVAVSPTGDKVYVTGSPNSTDDYATLAYNAATGAQLWAAHYYGRGGNGGHATSMAVSPTGDRVFVTGYANSGNPGGRQLGWEYSTVAYSG
jgi:outer membrane protein assembly factor BamB